MSEPSSPEAAPSNAGAALSDSSGQLNAVPAIPVAIPADKTAASASPARDPRADDQPRLPGHCLWPAVEVSGPSTGQLQFRRRTKPKVPLSAVLPSVPAPTAKPRSAAESSSNTGVFERVPSGVHPAADSTSRLRAASGRISSTKLQQPSAKRSDPRAKTDALPRVQAPATEVSERFYTWARRALYVVIVAGAVAVGGVIGMLQTALGENAPSIKVQVVPRVNISEMRDRMSKLESECASNRALIKQQELELKGMQCDMSEYERTKLNLDDRMNSARLP